MLLLLNLPVEVLEAVVQASDTVSTLNSIARTCRHLKTIANPILHRRALQEKACWDWATKRDRGDIFERVLAHQITSRWVFRAHDLNVCLLEALKAGSFRIANILLDAGAEVLYSAGSRQCPRCDETVDWLKGQSRLHLGSLAIAARSRYHLTFWYRSIPVKPYNSETEYWRLKKRAMEKILRQLRKDLDQNRLKNPEVSRDEYQRELDIALVEAASADAHSIELMDFLLTAGANINADASVNAGVDNSPQVVGQVWHSAVDEEVPSLFRAKVEFLINHGVDTTRVWSWHGVQTTIDFFLRKLQWAYLYTGDASFVERNLLFTDILESFGCLQWPQVRFGHSTAENGSLPDMQVRDVNEPGARELQMIFDDDPGSMKSMALLEALRSHLRRKQPGNCAETSSSVAEQPEVYGTKEIRDFDACCLELPRGIEGLEELYRTWIAERQCLNVT
ncbi:hypothetical protein CkaCkLH20_09269 [Colletotrichum karsti]|uniref:F-box domain-containing protein n=1 Tax=Colletotrichum karsti TaxID=1095194 RepID=A0A9P6LHE8_9PEZI|nr:uncharacterized protein CkaCkLH20_09269 [Colletotrichum karsti]KAF9873106.1 hypothetical protein CkaCkLH20_09269 [Colletotrichum karsti]